MRAKRFLEMSKIRQDPWANARYDVALLQPTVKPVARG